MSSIDLLSAYPMSRSPSNATVTQSRTQSATTRSPVDVHQSFAQRRLSRETVGRMTEASPRQSRRSFEKPAAAAVVSDSSSSSSEPEALHPMVRSRAFARRPRYSSAKPPHSLSDADEEDEDSPPFLPFSGAQETVSPSKTPTPRDQAATVKISASKPVISRHKTLPAETSKIEAQLARQPQHSSSSSAQSQPQSQRPSRHGHASTLSPRQRRAMKEGSSRSPSIGSSFSDLDDASITQSALEEALANEMTQGGVASKMSTISQALKSRYL